MDKSLLIAIFVPTTDEAGADFKGKRGELATGYLVGTDLILTAGHIPGDHRTIAMNAIQYGYAGIVPVGDPADWTMVPNEDIVWPNQDDLDAVRLLCCYSPIRWFLVSFPTTGPSSE
ncbi:MAG: hypothetical protein R3F40_07225 [Candidatus Competibacteraceae bacterium]